MCETVVKTLGSKPFHLRGPLNSSVLDATMCAVLEANGNLPPDFKERYAKLCADADFQEKIRVSTTDTVTVRTRIRNAKKFLKL